MTEYGTPTMPWALQKYLTHMFEYVLQQPHDIGIIALLITDEEKDSERD